MSPENRHIDDSGSEAMRSVNAFTDGRIHVTLFEGAFDLADLDEVDKSIYEGLLATFMVGKLDDAERLADPSRAPFAVTLRLTHREPLATLFADICRRMALEEMGLSAMVEEFMPWRPEESRALFEDATNYRPVQLVERLKMAA